MRISRTNCIRLRLTFSVFLTKNSGHEMTSIRHSIMIFWTSIILICGVGVSATTEVRYRYFDDYLSSLNVREQAIITGDVYEPEGSGEDEFFQNDQPSFTPTIPLRTGLTRSKDVACCSLGQLAGDKGYHCYAKFYAARIMLRNQNRAHNRKMAFHGVYSIPNYGTKLMRTFEQCVALRGMVFHKCCHLAATDRKLTPHYDSWQRKKFQVKQERRRIPRHALVDETGF